MPKIILDKDYDGYAKDLADIQRLTDICRKKLEEYQKSIKININRLTIYVRNQFKSDYLIEKHVMLFRRDDKIEIRTAEEVELAKKKYDEYKDAEDDSWLLKELEMVNSEFDIIPLVMMNDGDDFEEFYNTYDKIKQYLPETKDVYEVTKDQKEKLKELIKSCDSPQYHFLIEKMEALQESYMDIVDEVLDNLNESEYDFDISTDELSTVRNEKDLTWRLVIEKNKEK